MNEHISDNQWQRYRKNALTVKELFQFDAHLQTCVECQTRLAEHEQVANSFVALHSDLSEAMAELNAHLEYEELAAYLDRQLTPPDLNRVETHLQSCNNCAAEVEDLRAFQQELDAPIATNKSARPFRLTDWWQAWWQAFSWRWAMPLAAVATCLLIVWFGARMLRPGKVETPEQKEIAKITEPSPTAKIPSESLIASVNDGASQITLDAADNLVGPPAFSPTQQQLVIAALKSGKVNLTPAPTGLKARAETLLGDPGKEESFALISPVGKIELSPRPQLRWQALSGATSYRVLVFTTNYETVAQSEALTGTTWTVPRSLASNQIYVWQVIAVKDGREIKAPVAPAPEARFKILDQAKAKEIAAARDSHLLMGLLYAQAGMRDEAERELQILAKENPKTSIAQQLLDNLRAQSRPSRP
ncbi:MAG TPA: zf-HC2 domain-containing protein [Blastocatellia bacterium]|nr:zf-HC2 domain-containing protein [Blastocatellia bacterium]